MVKSRVANCHLPLSMVLEIEKRSRNRIQNAEGKMKFQVTNEAESPFSTGVHGCALARMSMMSIL